MKRRLFVSGAAFTGLVGCAGGATSMFRSAATENRKTSLCTDITCPQPCGLPTPNPKAYKYELTATVGNSGSSLTGYNEINNYSGFGYDSSKTEVYSGTLTANANGPTYSSSHSVIGHNVNVNATLPAVTSDTNFTVTDNNGIVHNMSVVAATASVTDTFSASQGGTWTVKVSTIDGVNWTVSYSNTSGGSGTFSFTTSSSDTALHSHSLATLAYVPSLLSDGVDRPVELAQKPCCTCINDSMLVALLAAGLMAGLAFVAGPEVLALGTALYVFGLGASYIGAAGATLGWLYNRYHC